ncbi:T-cell surface protein tactile isoform X4 [Rousettus aegyptiacus]|uniref:T-cell surface protein tactile isoform X4 n=1 Tax=Rousettus aegyptiacus TaxID=9407 RepID=UPI0007891610|nr:T-cell surface protein tactile isoform X4 [Rousettus aegyptiacus]
MEKKWTYCAVYSIIQIHFVRGVWEETFNSGKDIYALPGSDVNLTCQTQKKGILVQTQWSKVTEKVDLIALYHPQRGFYCANGIPCTSLVAFTETPGNVSKWTLLLKNMSSSLSGKYECSFTLYPEGIQTKIYNLLIKTNVIQDEWRSNNTIEIEINDTLEIPCFQNISSEISSEFTFAWLVEDNGTQETLITEDHSISNSTLFKDRVKLGTDYGLYLSPVQIHDDDRKFSCHVIVRTGKVLRNSTTIKVFAKPEMPVIEENNSTNFLGERIFTCSLRNVYPTANLTWFVDRSFPRGEREEIYTTTEERKNKGSAAPPTDPALNFTESTLDIQTSSANSVSPTSYPATSSITLVDVSTLTPNATPPTSWMPSEMYSPFPSNADSELHGDVFTSTFKALSNVLTTANGSTESTQIHITGIVDNSPKDGMSWPVIVAALLFICLVLFGLGVKKWCQYQKEIMERPPPFKPPPPPIKYICIQESIGRDLPCHEMETL